jgi:hypothetical protein
MRDELDQKLVAAFPHLYRDRGKSEMETCMYWGFECGDGWFDLLWDLSSKLEALIVKMKEGNPNIGVEYLPAASQVKGKFGGLRFYMTTETDEMMDLIGKAEEKSYRTCELCGKTGTATPTRWISVRCAEHWPKDCEVSFDDALKNDHDSTCCND